MAQTKEIKPPRTTGGIPVYMSMAQIDKYTPENNQVYVIHIQENVKDNKLWYVEIARDRKVCTCTDLGDALRIAKHFINSEGKCVHGQELGSPCGACYIQAGAPVNVPTDRLVACVKACEGFSMEQIKKLVGKDK